ncbi:MAG: tail fiber protein [Pseudomonadota bacterium]|jgi:microcystin-dependent protein|uniref:Microcystin dependent protein n=1 Tax=hydrothermal vent metagenome TaxID=652676 RepID=A0A161KCS9_9ZZZZ
MTQPFIGEIRIFPWDFSVRGWALAQGQLLSIQQNQALFSLLGTTYGGNGIQTFGLPDLRGRTPLGQGQAPFGGSYTMGQTSGTETVQLLITQIPQHTHQLVGTSATATKRGPAAHTIAADTSTIVDFYAAAVQAQLTQLAPTAIANQGGNAPHSNMQPYLTMNYSIALQGRFPSRN